MSNQPLDNQSFQAVTDFCLEVDHVLQTTHSSSTFVLMHNTSRSSETTQLSTRLDYICNFSHDQHN